jgi:hypothetical protein
MKLFRVVVSIVIVACSLQGISFAWWPFSTQETPPITFDAAFDTAKQQHAESLYDLYVEHNNKPPKEALADFFQQSLGNVEPLIQAAQKRELYRLAAEKAYTNNNKELHKRLDYQTWTTKETVLHYGRTYGIPIGIIAVLGYICYEQSTTIEKLVQQNNTNVESLKETFIITKKLENTVKELEIQINNAINENECLKDIINEENQNANRLDDIGELVNQLTDYVLPPDKDGYISPFKKEYIEQNLELVETHLKRTSVVFTPPQLSRKRANSLYIPPIPLDANKGQENL